MPPSRSIPFSEAPKRQPTRVNSLLWAIEPLENDGGHTRKRMFGCDAAYMDGLLCLVVADRGAPWNGILVCTAVPQHGALMAELPALQPHPTLGKWLYLSQDDEAFEETALQLSQMVLARDPRIGVPPQARTRKRKTSPTAGPGRT